MSLFPVGRRIEPGHVGVIVCVVLAAAFVISWEPGRDASWDSGNYLDGARHLAAGTGYTTSRGALGRSEGLPPITLWPPGFSLLIVPIIWAGGSPVTAAAVVLGASYALLLGTLCGVCLLAGASGWFLAIAIALACVNVGLMPSMLEATEAVLSDLPFAAFVGVATVLTLKQARAPRSSVLRKVVTGAAIAWTFWLRYAGAGIVAGLLTGLWLAQRGLTARERIRNLFPIAAVVAVVDGALVLRNLASHGSAVGGRSLEPTNAWRHLRRAAGGVLQWAQDAARHSHGRLKVDVVYILAAVAILGVLVALVRGRAFRSDAVVILGIALGAYVSTMGLSASLSTFNDLDHSRFWVASWPLSAAFVVAVLANVESPGVRWFLAPAGLVGVLCAYLFFVSALAGLEQPKNPRELSKREWVKASTQLPEPSECGVLTNEIRPFLIHREVAPNRRLPYDVEEVDELAKAGPLCIVFVKAPIPPSSSRFAKGHRALIRKLSEAGRLYRTSESKTVDVYRLVR